VRFWEEAYVLSVESECEHDREMVADSLGRNWLAGESRSSTDKKSVEAGVRVAAFRRVVTRSDNETFSQDQTNFSLSNVNVSSEANRASVGSVLNRQQ
jgi:hypothetical protein